jgi:hypothetical protein
MNKAGWYSADMHVHRDPRELGRILLAEDLNFAPTITYHVWSEKASQPFPNASSFPVVVDDLHFFTANSEEVERIQGGLGAVILLAPGSFRYLFKVTNSTLRRPGSHAEPTASVATWTGTSCSGSTPS